MNNRFNVLRERLEERILGQQPFIEGLLCGLLCGGHMLIEGLPGLAKTTAVRTLAEATRLAFQRIQFTPDMIPGDITGSEILRGDEGRFDFIPGPLFSDIVLADEINRAPPKVQSALLEAMQEGQITVSGQTRPLPEHFLVIATQNPIEHEGTYPLPEAQLDRFMLKLVIDYPDQEVETRLVINHLRDTIDKKDHDEAPLLDGQSLSQAQQSVREIYLDDMLARYIVTLVNVSRRPADWDQELADWLSLGASPRASLALAHAARAQAFLRQRDFVEPDDILRMAPAVIGHRLAASFLARSGNISNEQIVQRIIDRVPIP